MKWFFGLVLILNLMVAGYGALKVRAPQDIHAQEVSPAMLKVLPAGWKPPVEASLPVANASAPVAQTPAASASAPVARVAAASAPLASKPAASATTPAPAPAKSKAPLAKDAAVLACRQWGPLTDSLFSRVKGGLPSLSLRASQWSQSSADTTTGTGKVWVYYPPLNTHAETQTLSSELKSKGFDNYIVQTDDHKGAVSLGLFGKEAAARALMAKIKAAGYDKVAMVARESKASSSVLTFRELDSAAVARLEALQKRLTPGIRLKSCE